MRAPTAKAIVRRLERRGLLMRPIVMSGLWSNPDEACARRMAAFDALTPALRQAVDNSICDFNPHAVLDRLRWRGEGYALRLIRSSELEARTNWHSQRGRVLADARASFGPWVKNII